MQADLAGDPSGRRGVWTGLRLEQISQALADLDIAACPNTVRRLLDKLDYSLQANRKSFSPKQSPDRDRQFRCIRRQRQKFQRMRCPIISVDTKKKELIGHFANRGRVWSRQAPQVNDHDFPSWALGLAIPYGLHDSLANRGSVFVGTTHDTPAFATEAIAAWWRREGQARYANAQHLLILADSGGSNGARCRAWKLGLQEQVADRYQLHVTVCHYPTGASKWNPVEHRLFGEISKHWAGKPLDSYETILREIRETRTRTGLRVKSYLVTKSYETGQKVSDLQFSQIDLAKHAVLPKWNYTIHPRQNRN